MPATKTVESAHKITGFSGLRRSSIARVQAGTSPVYYWGPPTDADLIAKAKEAFHAWETLIKNNDKAFEQYVYNNPNLNEADMIQFRSRVFTMLAHGEELTLQFYRLAASNKMDATDYFKKLDAHMQALINALNQWNAPLDVQPDIPQSFKDAVQELERGELEPLEDILEEQ